MNLLYGAQHKDGYELRITTKCEVSELNLFDYEDIARMILKAYNDIQKRMNKKLLETDDPII